MAERTTETVYVSFIKDENGNDTIFPNGLMTMVSGDVSRYKRLKITNYYDSYFIYGKSYLSENGDDTWTIVTPQEAIDEEKRDGELSLLRSIRSTLLVGFDLWEKAVLRGRESDDPLVMEWYRGLLDLDADVIKGEVPDRIKYYLGQ